MESIAVAAVVKVDQETLYSNTSPTRKGTGTGLPGRITAPSDEFPLWLWGDSPACGLLASELLALSPASKVITAKQVIENRRMSPNLRDMANQ